MQRAQRSSTRHGMTETNASHTCDGLMHQQMISPPPHLAHVVTCRHTVGVLPVQCAAASTTLYRDG